MVRATSERSVHGGPMQIHMSDWGVKGAAAVEAPSCALRSAASLAPLLHGKPPYTARRAVMLAPSCALHCAACRTTRCAEFCRAIARASAPSDRAGAELCSVPCCEPCQHAEPCW